MKLFNLKVLFAFAGIVLILTGIFAGGLRSIAIGVVLVFISFATYLLFSTEKKLEKQE